MLGVIISTKNRSELLIRTLRYYSKTKNPPKIYIGDSSEGINLENTINYVKNVRHKLNIQHFKLPGMNSGNSNKAVLEEFKEKYVAFLGDDDFLVPNSLKKCVDYLEKNPDYASAMGRSALFETNDDCVYGTIKVLQEYGRKYGDVKSDIESASQRLEVFLKNYWVPIFSVHYADIAKESFAVVNEDFDNTFTEIMPGSIILANGKSKLLDCLYLIRQIHNKRVLNPNKLDWIVRDNWLSSFRLFVDSTAKVLVKREGISTDSASNIVRESFEDYLFESAKHKIKRGFENNKLKKMKTFIKAIPYSKHLYDFFVDKKPLKKIIRLEYLLNSKSDYHQDFIPVFDAITSNEN